LNVGQRKHDLSQDQNNRRAPIGLGSSRYDYRIFHRDATIREMGRGVHVAGSGRNPLLVRRVVAQKNVEPAARARGPQRPWLILNVRQKNRMKRYRWILIAICLVATLSHVEGSTDASREVVVLPKFVVEADGPEFLLAWRCKWPTQKSKIVRAWIKEVPKAGILVKAGLEVGDSLLQYDGIAVTDVTGEWLAERFERGWKPGEAHEFLVERIGKKLKITIETKKKMDFHR
jgi:hypothetical protein